MDIFLFPHEEAHLFTLLLRQIRKLDLAEVCLPRKQTFSQTRRVRTPTVNTLRKPKDSRCPFPLLSKARGTQTHPVRRFPTSFISSFIFFPYDNLRSVSATETLTDRRNHNIARFERRELDVMTSGDVERERPARTPARAQRSGRLAGRYFWKNPRVFLG